MVKKLLLLLISGISFVGLNAQVPEQVNIPEPKRTSEPFLFSVSTLTPHDLAWSIDYSASYGERVSGAFGQEGIGQQFAVKGYLGKQFTLYANMALGIAGKDEVSSRQHAEILRNFIGGKKSLGLRLGAGLGVSRDFSNEKSIMSRITLSYDAPNWKTGGNILLEKAFGPNRDAIDVITSFGFHYRLAGRLYGGLETIGEDLEGFWDPQEAEGGAKLLVGPSLNMSTNNSRLTFSVSGGPVFYATRNALSNPDAIRDLPAQSGLSLRARVIFNLSQ